MSDAFLPGNGFDTYETQDKVLVSMDGTVDCGVAVRILQQQGFGVAGAVVQLAADQSLGRSRTAGCRGSWHRVHRTEGGGTGRPARRGAGQRQRRPVCRPANRCR